MGASDPDAERSKRDMPAHHFLHQSPRRVARTILIVARFVAVPGHLMVAHRLHLLRKQALDTLGPVSLFLVVFPIVGTGSCNL